MTITSGEFDFLFIGQTKQQVIDALNKNGVIGFSPKVDEFVRISRLNLNEISQLSNSNGLVLNGRDYYARMKFNNGILYDLYLAPINEKNDLGIKLSDSMEVVLSKLEKVISEDPYFYVFNVIPESVFVDLSKMDQSDRKYIEIYNTWNFSVLHEYSSYTISFKDGLLAKIVYFYTPVELP